MTLFQKLPNRIVGLGGTRPAPRSEVVPVKVTSTTKNELLAEAMERGMPVSRYVSAILDRRGNIIKKITCAG